MPSPPNDHQRGIADECHDHPLFTPENIYKAYRRCRRRKRGTINALIFEQNMEENLLSLHEELTTGTYRPGRSLAFLVEKPSWSSGKRRSGFFSAIGSSWN